MGVTSGMYMCTPHPARMLTCAGPLGKCRARFSADSAWPLLPCTVTTPQRIPPKPLISSGQAGAQATALPSSRCQGSWLMLASPEGTWAAHGRDRNSHGNNTTKSSYFIHVRQHHSALGGLVRRWRHPLPPLQPASCSRAQASSMPSVVLSCVMAADLPPSQIARPKTVHMQYMLLFSHRTVRLPSVVLSHQQEAAVCRPAPANTIWAEPCKIPGNVLVRGDWRL